MTDFVRDAITPPTGRSEAIPAELKVITTLRYLATGKMQLCSGDDRRQWLPMPTLAAAPLPPT